jgi:hypothetical protein
MRDTDILMVRGRLEKIVNANNVARLEAKGWKVFKPKKKKAKPVVEEFDGVPAEIQPDEETKDEC